MANAEPDTLARYDAGSEDRDTESTRLPLRRRPWFQRLLTWGALIIVWQVFAVVVGSYFWPSWQDVLRGFVTVLTTGGVELVASSFLQMFVGFGLAIAVGVPIGLTIGSFRTVALVVEPYVNLLFVTSLAAVLPLLILLFGTGFTFRVAVVFLFAVFYVIINPANGVRSIDPNLVDVSRSFGVGPVRRFFVLTAPATLPFTIAGVRLGLGQAVQGMIIAELWVTTGTGRELKALSQEHVLGQFFALAMVVVLVGTLLSQLLLWAQRLITPWAASTSGVGKGDG
ncbi:ABC transporter permease [Mycobacterium sp. NAZ190054]|uniref:ABC transporter permease n=1 Tax=Mycobacterium sp. NAZ190054 TaxID=1747766 RepID=UPI000791CE3A|nr:ABC transporter permease subunit [Mycobacterium sp. NAZ190054]KWX67405.1 hypothetical protein ASJ79_21695 [Mycobacterium sp. NAZ190054]